MNVINTHLPVFQPFGSAYQGVHENILQCCDLRTRMSFAEVCKGWNKHPAISRERGLQQQTWQAAQDIGYPAVLVSVFRKNNIHIWDLPLLDLRDRMGSTHYIDFLTKKDLTVPVMRFTDKLNRVGIAMKICKRDVDISQIDRNSIVFTLFRRYIIHRGVIDNTWVHTESFRFQAAPIYLEQERMHKNSHKGSSQEICPSCPKTPDNDLFGFTENLLNGQEITFKIVGEVTQVRNPLPASIQIDIALQEQTLLQKIVAKVYHLFFCFLRECAAFFNFAKNVFIKSA